MFVRKTAVLILFFCLISGLVFWQREASADTYVRVDRPELNGAVLLVADLMDIGEPQVILGRQNGLYRARNEVQGAGVLVMLQL